MITLTKEQLKNNYGVHGAYVKLTNSLGIKVIHSRIYSTKAKAHRSVAYKRAVIESENLEYAYETGVVPKSFGVTLVKIRNGFMVGVLMQHLGRITLSNSEFYEDASVYDELNDKLEDIGMSHEDLHDDNIMVYRGKFYVIDFSPESIHIEE